MVKGSISSVESSSSHNSLTFLHHGCQELSFGIQFWTFEYIELKIVPLLRRPRLSVQIRKLSIVIHAQEIRNAVPILVLPLLERNNAMHNTRQLSAGQEAQEVTDVDNCVPGTRFQKLPAFRLGRHELETPLLGKYHGERTDIGVLEMSYIRRRCSIVVLGVMKKDKRGKRGLGILMVGLES